MALVGGILGLVAALISIPLIPRVSFSDKGLEIGLGAIYHPIQYVLLGFLVSGAIAMLVTDNTASPERTLLSGVIGAVLGAGLTFLAGCLFHVVSVRLVESQNEFVLEPLAWDVLVCSAMALAIGLATQPRTRLKRIATATVAGMVVSHFIHRAMIYVTLFLLFGMVMKEVSSLPSHPGTHQPGAQPAVPSRNLGPANIPLLLGAFVGLGVAMGFCFGLVDLTGGSGWVAARGKGEGKSAAVAPYPVVPPGGFVPPPPPPGVRPALVDDMGNAIDLGEGTHSIGRDPSCRVSLNYDPLVSRNHAELTIHGGSAVLTDLGSRNGTSVNGQQISGPVQLSNGDAIRFGRTGFVYRDR